MILPILIQSSSRNNLLEFVYLCWKRIEKFRNFQYTVLTMIFSSYLRNNTKENVGSARHDAKR